MSEVCRSKFTGREYSTKELVQRLLGLAWRFKGDCLLSLLLSIALLVLALGGWQFLGLTIDVIRHGLDSSQPKPQFPFAWQPPERWTALHTVTALSLGIIAQALLRAVLTYAYNMTTARLTQGKMVPELRDQLYAKLQRLSFRFFEIHGSSSIFNRVTGDVQNTRLFVDGVMLQGSTMFLTLAAYFIFMWRIETRLTLACLSVTIGLWYLTHFYSIRLRPAYVRNRELLDELVALFTDSVRGMQTIKGFAAEKQQSVKFESANRMVSEQQNRIFLNLSLFTPATQVLSQLSLVILFGYGGWMFVHGRLQLGSGLVVFAGLLQQFNGQVANITNVANSIQQSFTAARRVFEVLDTPTEVESKVGALPVKSLNGKLIFENVTFGYEPRSPVLTQISFEVRPGQVIGVFGMTGAGKSSLLSLIGRFYDPQGGRILADGQDLRELDLDQYRRRIGIVHQETFLFSNTVAANIAFGNPQATQEQIEEAARTACAAEFIQTLPQCYETVLGESGVDLSGGQRQRLALARALLLQPPVLLLDDPMASGDAKTEQDIVAALLPAMRGRTTFVSANRLSLLRKADMILVLEKGHLIASGRHDDLVKVPGPYRETALLQLMDLGDEHEAAPESTLELTPPG